MRWDFFDVVSDSLYVDLDKNYKKILFREANNKAGSQRKLAKLFNIVPPAISNWIHNKAFCPLHTIKKLDKYSGLNKFNKSKILGIFSRNKLTNLKEIKTEIKFNQNFARFLGHICGDGSIHKKYVVSYTNLNKDLLNDFIKCTKKTFGNIIIRKEKHKDGTTNLYLSAIIGRFLTNSFKKIKQKNPPIDLIKRSPKSIKEFLGAIFDDEGHISYKKRSLEITLANKYLLECVKQLFETIGIKTSRIRMKSGRERRIYWRLLVTRRKNFIKFSNLIKLKHKKKQSSLKKLVNSYKKKFVDYELEEAILNKLKNGSKTSTELANELHVLRTSACKTLAKLKNKGFTRILNKKITKTNYGNIYSTNMWSLA